MVNTMKNNRNKLGQAQLMAYDVIKKNNYIHRVVDLRTELDHLQLQYGFKLVNKTSSGVGLKHASFQGEISEYQSKMLVEQLNDIIYRWGKGRELVMKHNLGKRWYGDNNQDRNSNNKQVERLNILKWSFIDCNRSINYKGKFEYFNYIHKNIIKEKTGWFASIVNKIKQVF